MEKVYLFTKQELPGVIIAITSDCFADAEEVLHMTVKNNYNWKVDNAEGEEEEI